MAINISVANNQAAQLHEYTVTLQRTKQQLSYYKSILTANWQGSEVGYFVQSIDKAIAQINAVINELNATANDIKNAAETIKREEEAAAAAARARVEKQRRIAIAEREYNEANNELSELLKSRDEFVKKTKGKRSLSKKEKDALDELNKKIAEAEKKCNDRKNALAAARR